MWCMYMDVVANPPHSGQGTHYDTSSESTMGTRVSIIGYSDDVADCVCELDCEIGFKATQLQHLLL